MTASLQWADGAPLSRPHAIAVGAGRAKARCRQGAHSHCQTGDCAPRQAVAAVKLEHALPFLPRSALGAVQRRFIAASSQLAPRCHAGLKKKQGAKLMQHSLVAAVVGGLMCLAASTFATQAAPPLATQSVEPKAGLVQAVEYPYHRRHHHHYRRHHHVFQHHWRYDHWRHDHWRHHYWRHHHRHHHHRRHHHHD
jgi:hypothetical protein